MFAVSIAFSLVLVDILTSRRGSVLAAGTLGHSEMVNENTLVECLVVSVYRELSSGWISLPGLHLLTDNAGLCCVH